MFEDDNNWSSDRNKNKNNTDRDRIYNNIYNNNDHYYNDNEHSTGLRNRGGLTAGGGSTDNTRYNNVSTHDDKLYNEFMAKTNNNHQSNYRSDNFRTDNNVDTSNISADTPIKDRKKPPIKSITSTVNMDLFHSPGARSANKLKSLNSNDKTPTRRREYDKSGLYTSIDAVNNSIHTPNSRYSGMSPIDSSYQKQHQHVHHHESNNNIIDKLDYEYWVLVSGLNSNDNQSVTSMLVHFQRFGDIREYLVGKGNWIFLRFTTTSSANQALAADHDIVNNNFIIVEGLNPQLAHKLGVTYDTSGKLVATYNQTSNNSTSTNGNASSNNLAKVSIGEGLFDRNRYQNEAYKDFMSPVPVNYHPTGSNPNPFHMSTMSPNRYLQPPVKKKDCCRWFMEIFGLNY